MGSYDRADWHYGGEGFPEGAPEEKGGTHIGMFLAWCIINHLEGDFHKVESKESLEAVREREMTGTDFLFRECDQKFWEEDLSEEGNEFAKHYYESNAYFTDYDYALGQKVESILPRIKNCD